MYLFFHNNTKITFYVKDGSYTNEEDEIKISSGSNWSFILCQFGDSLEYLHMLQRESDFVPFFGRSGHLPVLHWESDFMPFFGRS